MENTKEIWTGAKTFDQDYSNEYLVSNMGRCYNLKTKRFVGAWHKENGYFNINLHKDKKNSVIMIGRLMLISFDIPIPEHLKNLPTNKIQASHIDEDKTHNYLWNFCWENAKENSGRPLHGKRSSEAKKGKHLGKEHHNSKSVLQYTKSGELIREWDCAADVHRELGIHQSNISACCQGKPKYKTAGGYVWRYKNEET